MSTITKKEFIELTGENPEDMFGGDWQNTITEIQDCFHECSSNCRRVGCNCACGEYHINLKGKQ